MTRLPMADEAVEVNGRRAVIATVVLLIAMAATYVVTRSVWDDDDCEDPSVLQEILRCDQTP